MPPQNEVIENFHSSYYLQGMISIHNMSPYCTGGEFRSIEYDILW